MEGEGERERGSETDASSWASRLSSGFASLDYEDAGWERSDNVKVRLRFVLGFEPRRFDFSTSFADLSFSPQMTLAVNGNTIGTSFVRIHSLRGVELNSPPSPFDLLFQTRFPVRSLFPFPRSFFPPANGSFSSFSVIVHRSDAQQIGKAWVLKLKGILPKQQFEVRPRSRFLSLLPFPPDTDAHFIAPRS